MRFWWVTGSAFTMSIYRLSPVVPRRKRKRAEEVDDRTSTAPCSLELRFVVSARKPRSGLSGRLLKGKIRMSNILLKVYCRVRALLEEEKAQDLVEYAMLCCLITLSLITSMESIASAVNKTFTNISSSLS
jgi:Flp pilus assembly pilin Flp